jgi:hypothetical protein
VIDVQHQEVVERERISTNVPNGHDQAMVHKRFTAALLMFCLALSFFGCSRSNDADKKADSAKRAEKTTEATGPFEVNACSLMTQQEAEQLLNEKVRPPQEDQHLQGEPTRAAMSFCLFASDSGKSLSIFYKKSPIPENSPEAIQAVKNTISTGGSSVQEIKGVGNTAFWSGNELHVFEGERSYLVIAVDGFKDQEESSDKAKKAAEIALERV